MRDECSIDGHDWDVINRGFVPVKLMCNTCGEEYDVLSGDPKSLIELEGVQSKALADLQQALQQMCGKSLEEKMAVPEQRATLRRLTLRWVRTQRNLLAATSAHLDRSAPTNGH